MRRTSALPPRFRDEPIRLPVLYCWRIVLHRFCGMVDDQQNIREVWARYAGDARMLAARGAGNVDGFDSVTRIG